MLCFEPNKSVVSGRGGIGKCDDPISVHSIVHSTIPVFHHALPSGRCPIFLRVLFPVPDSTHHSTTSHSPFPLPSNTTTRIVRTLVRFRLILSWTRQWRHDHASTTASMATVVVILLLLPLLPSTAHAAFPYFLACGAASNVSFPGDSPARTFVPDAPFLSSAGRVPAVTSTGSNTIPPLYAAARAAGSGFSYSFADPDTATANVSRVLRLHFFPFTSSSSVNLSSASFSVSVRDAFTLLSSFSPPRDGVVKEYFVPGDGSGEFRVKFTPDAGSTAFVSAIELFPAPPELLWRRPVKPVGALVDSSDVNAWPQQALETVYRLNVGGSKVLPANDTLWRTWLPDDPYFSSPRGLSEVNSTSTRIIYGTSIGYTREVAPDSVYKTQRAMNMTSQQLFLTPGPFNLTWTFALPPPAPGSDSDYLVRLHWCDYSVVTSAVGTGIVFDVYVAQRLASKDLDRNAADAAEQPNEAFYLDYAATAPTTGNLTISIGKSDKNDAGGMLNGLEIMKLRRAYNLNSAGSHGRRKKILIGTLSAALGVAVLACALLCLLAVLRRRRQAPTPAPEEKESTQLPWSQHTQDGSSWVDMSNASGAGMTGGLHRMSMQLNISLADITAATENFNERNLIGVGGFGNVYSGVLRDGTRVAVKRAMLASKQGLPEFQTEIEVLSRIRHRHLVSLIGYCNEQSEMILVYEYMEKGTLRSHLYGSEEPALSWKQRLEICIGAARGLHYLHTGYSENIIHRDVKSTNILLGDAFIAKVADFGLSRIGPSFGETHVSTAVKGSFGYLDPEYFKTQQLTDRSDVYSFGVVLFEVLCARPVIDQSLERDEINLAEWAVSLQQKGELAKITDPRIAGQVNDNSLRKFAETAEKCLADYGLDRPSMGDVLWNLEYCLQLQETHVNRDAFEDSGAVATQFPADVVVPRWVPSSTSFLMDDSVTDSGIANSKAFSQLSSGDGR
uniref:Protein kinase domain-containing protein n=1 Tax=Oryza meridionalis TaxID=40149 RepID=A0A0E0CUF6_9ORYZ